MKNKKACIIACAVLAIDLKHNARQLGLDLEYRFLEAGLHSNPKKLKETLQAAIDEVSEQDWCNKIIIGYGVCGKGTVGVHARRVPLVIPKVHDCISLFLGGDAEYKAQFKRFPGTYYLSAGWCEEKTEPISQKKQWAYFGDRKLSFDDLEKSHGTDAAKTTIDFLSSWQKNYQRAAYIETGAKTSSKYENMAKEMAGLYDWQYDKIKGRPDLITKLIQAEKTTPDILFVPPDHVIGFDAIHSTLSANPVFDGEKQAQNLVSVVDAKEDTNGTDQYIRIGLGIDAGGTYTDAVIYDLEENKTVCKAKSLTTRWDFTIGISRALEKLDPDALQKTELVALSTTLATNAIVENEGQKVGLILMPPYGIDLSKEIPHKPLAAIEGQMEITGKEIVALDPDEIKTIVQEMIEKHHVRAFAVSGYAGSVNPAHELEVKQIIESQTGLFVSCGHELSDSLNFQTRATTAILNARIIPRIAVLLSDLEEVLNRFGLDAPMVTVKGDGTLMSTDMANQRPVETILSGPAASVAGAKHLTGISDALVVDMGGTTTDTATLAGGQVRLNEQGSRVGGFRTHVKALDIRTIGLGGDSLIGFQKGQFVIGPKRVAPISWLSQLYPGTRQAVDFLDNHFNRYRTDTRKMQILAPTGAKASFALSPLEEKILSLLNERPYSIDELVDITGVLFDGMLPLEQLEDHFIILRCGLTYTDLLHITGQFRKWDTDMAQRYCGIYAYLVQKEMPELIEVLLKEGMDRLSLEVLKRCLDAEVEPDTLNNCPVCQTFIKHFLNKHHPDFTVSFDLKHPVIGIGAPIQFFLSKAVTPLGTRAVLPIDADVANAIGAITSHVIIKRQIRITPDEQGGFVVGGISGTRHFRNFDRADEFAREHLVQMVRASAVEAGTSCKKITLETQDKMPVIASGDAVFMGRTIHATLKGRPDRVLAARN